VKRGEMDVVQELVTNGIGVNCMDGDGKSPLHWAAQVCHGKKEKEKKQNGKKEKKRKKKEKKR
jgi:ankyrin repeat protein